MQIVWLHAREQHATCQPQFSPQLSATLQPLRKPATALDPTRILPP
jgi:hypothetical protein